MQNAPCSAASSDSSHAIQVSSSVCLSAAASSSSSAPQPQFTPHAAAAAAAAMTPLRLCLLSSLLLLLAVVLSASGNTNTTSPCVANRCGRVDIRYPLWVDGDATSSHCGYPPLRVQCRGGDTPVLLLPSGDYGVTGIHYRDRTLSIFDLAVSINSSCPHVAGRNLTLPAGSPPPLELTSRNTNLTFFLDCTYSGFDSRRLVPCLTNGQRGSYVFRDARVPYEAAELCQQVVGTPVLQPLEDVIPALKDGFEISWSSPAVGGECERCEKAGGFCGERGEEVAQVGRWNFTCFSNNTSASTTSSHRPKLTTVGIVVIALVGGAMLICSISLCLIYWGKKRAQAEES